jgi:hypothetical protein
MGWRVYVSSTGWSDAAKEFAGTGRVVETVSVDESSVCAARLGRLPGWFACRSRCVWAYEQMGAVPHDSSRRQVHMFFGIAGHYGGPRVGSDCLWVRSGMVEKTTSPEAVRRADKTI